MTKIGKFLLIFTKASVSEKSLFFDSLYQLFGLQNKNSDCH